MQAMRIALSACYAKIDQIFILQGYLLWEHLQIRSQHDVIPTTTRTRGKDQPLMVQDGRRNVICKKNPGSLRECHITVWSPSGT
jgi:hypothetical protein